MKKSITLDEIIKIYKTNFSMYKTAKELNISSGTLTKIMNGLNTNFTKIKNNLFSKDLIIKQYAILNNVEKTAKFLKIPKTYVRNVLKKENKINKQIRYTHDVNFFSSINEKSLYWAGFIAADGNVAQLGPKWCTLKINLAIKDLLHLENFKKDINSTAPIKILNRKKTSCALQINSTQIFNDLQKYNIVPNKTLSYTFPKWLIDHPLVNHFMRGYFDGDGCVHIRLGKNKNTLGCLAFSMVGQENFLNIYKSILEFKTGYAGKNNIKKYKNNNNKLKKAYSKNKTINTYKVLSYAGNFLMKNIYNFLYLNSETYLLRKYGKFNSIFNLYKHHEPISFEQFMYAKSIVKNRKEFAKILNCSWSHTYYLMEKYNCYFKF